MSVDLRESLSRNLQGAIRTIRIIKNLKVGEGASLGFPGQDLLLDGIKLLAVLLEVLQQVGVELVLQGV